MMLINEISAPAAHAVGQTAASAAFAMRVHACRYEAQGVLSLELRSLTAAALPAVEPGAHIDVTLPNGLSRSYSLINAAGETHRYVIAVNRDRASRGASSFIHERLRVGDELAIGAPHNHFPLDESAELSVLFAGGIGITPLFSMVNRLDALGRRWLLHYCARSRSCAPFAAPLLDLAARGNGAVQCHFDDETGHTPDLREWLGAVPANAHLYCCGPAPMLDTFIDACSARPPSHVHWERFGAAQAAAVAGGFNVVLSRTGITLPITAGKSILDALLEHGIDVPHACKQGVCGSCETRVLAGELDHRDSVLGDTERASGRMMMICCSGCKGSELVLDL